MLGLDYNLSCIFWFSDNIEGIRRSYQGGNLRNENIMATGTTKNNSLNYWIQKLHVEMYRADYLLTDVFSDTPRKALFCIAWTSHSTKFENLCLLLSPNYLRRTIWYIHGLNSNGWLGGEKCIYHITSSAL